MTDQDQLDARERDELRAAILGGNFTRAVELAQGAALHPETTETGS